jgi:lipopolysaccharide/colanic/teichoic acid biosynthesis glycosyltransferase
MELKYFIVGRGKIAGNKSKDKNILFLVTQKEEDKVRNSVFEQGDSWTMTRSEKLITDHQLDLSFVRQLMILDAGSLVVTNELIEAPEIAELLCEAHVLGLKVMSLREALCVVDPRVSSQSPEMIRSFISQAVYQNARYRIYQLLKSVLERGVAAALLLLTAPITLFVMAMIRLTSAGPALYSQTRAGLRGKPFKIYKFRSMRIDAEKNGPIWACAQENDSRLTPIGGILRATHIDEIPQLWNVVRGELSFIGPRPERPHFINQLVSEIPLFRLRMLVRPGISGWAQIHQGYANSVEDSRVKLEYDLYYVMRQSPWLDLKIVIGTLALMMGGGTEGRKRERVSALGLRPRPMLDLPRRPSVVYKLPSALEI